jgi:hypothetical protein
MKKTVILFLILIGIGGLVFGLVYIKAKIDTKPIPTLPTELSTQEIVPEVTKEAIATEDESFVIMKTIEFSPEETRDPDFIYMDETQSLTPRDNVSWMIDNFHAKDVINGEFEHENFLIAFCSTDGEWNSGFDNEVKATVTNMDTGEVYREVIGPESGTIWIAGPNMTMKDYTIHAEPCP